MRWLLLFLLFPFAAQAADTHITVEYVVTQERIDRPDPIIIHPHITVQLVLHENGTVDDYDHIPGPYAKNIAHGSRLGEQRVKVVDSHTITRSWSIGPQQRKLTVVTSGSNCTAKLEISGPSEFAAYSTYSNTKALYRNAHVDSINCRIE
jgi:hypothetical protein